MSLFAGTGLVVKLVLIILLYFSVVSWTIICLKLVQVKRANDSSERFLEFFWNTKRFDAIYGQLERFSRSPLSALFREGYAEMKRLREKGEEKDDPTVISTDLGGIDNIARALRRATTSEITVTFLPGFRGMVTFGICTPRISMCSLSRPVREYSRS